MVERRESVRIVVAEPAPQQGGAKLGTVEALSRLGPAVCLDLAHDSASCLELTRAVLADLVVLDRDLGLQGEQILAALRSTGPPVIVVTPESTADVALEAFRGGAADCVTVSRDYQEVLPAVALEQIRAWRAASERRAVRRRIESLERLHSAIVDQFPAALAVMDWEDRIVAVNPEFRRAFLGAREGDGPEGDRLQAILPADLIESGALLDLIERARSRAEREPRIARTHHDGGLLSFDARAERLDEEGRILLVLSDVTERERLAKRVQDLQGYLENVIQNMNSGLAVVDSDGRITAANPTAGQILGAPGSLLGRLVWDWFPGPSREDLCITRTLAEGARIRGAETLIVRSDGRFVPIGISSAPLVDADGSRLGAVTIFQDLSEIKQLQRQVLQTEKMASIGQLAAGVAHEINNPMGFIHANLFQMEEYLGDLRNLLVEAERLREAAVADGSPAVREIAERFARRATQLDGDFLVSDFAKAVRESQEGSERIRHIVQDLRAFSHRDDGELVEADVNQCLDSTANIVWAMMKHSVVLRKEYAELEPVRCYPMQLKQVFMNLLVNAYQAIEQRVREQGGTGEIVLRTRADEQSVVVSVSDDGSGIAPENAHRIFDPFFTTKEVGVGTGLGLSTSFNIVRRHGGTIRAEERRGGGTTFEVHLPRSGPSGLPQP